MNKIYDLAGIGIGPSNLSTAALLNPLKDEVSSIFFDNKSEFNWHPGLMFPDAKLQVSILKDLVTMLDPTSEFSFLNYLRENRKLYIFASRNGFNNVRRREFEDYLKWAVSKLDNLNFNSPIDEISPGAGHFEIKTGDRVFHAKNIVMGAGLTSNVPDFCRRYLSSTCFHSSQFLKEYNNYCDKTVTLVGSGQSSCEILKFMLTQEEHKLPKRINWIIKSHKLNVLENTPFANELYNPNYSEFIYSLPPERKAKLIHEQKFTSDGVSDYTLNEIYDLLYHNDFGKFCQVELFHDAVVSDVNKVDDVYHVSINKTKMLESDVIILGTGFQYKIPSCIENLSRDYRLEGGAFLVDECYRLIPHERHAGGNIFIHNGAKHMRGVADPNLSLLAWRSGIIINTLMERDVYNIKQEKSIVSWDNMKQYQV